MLDIKRLRTDLNAVAQDLAKRGYHLDTQSFMKIEESHRALIRETEQLQANRNQLSKQIGQAKSQGQEAVAQDLQVQVAQIKTRLQESEAQLARVEQELEQWLLSLPNCPDVSVPMGNDERDNVLYRQGSAPIRKEGRDHIDLLDDSGLILTEKATQLSGARFSVLKGPVARLHRALTQFMLSFHTEVGYTEYYVPYLVQPHVLVGTGQLPKAEADMFKIAGDHPLYLIPTAEVPLTNLLADSIVSGQELPIRMMAHTPCFRSEAGSYGKDLKGIFRQHQFEKVELVHATSPERSFEELEWMVSHVEKLLQALELPYRIMTLCTGDIGFTSSKTYDFEVWLPSQQRYREISSCSNCQDFQARRMRARYRFAQQDKPELLHTLNGSGVAVGRALIALIENHGHPDGCDIPEALRPFLGGVSFLKWN